MHDLDTNRRPLVQPIDKIEPKDIEKYGGKATNLARLSLRGFQIPNGFSISSVNFERMKSVIPEIGITLKRIEETEDFEEMISLSEEIQNQITSYIVPDNLQLEIEKNYHQLQNLVQDSGFGYAIRSSATIEDCKDISFAGMAKSYLCIEGIPHVIDAMKMVWQSTFSPGALIYLKAKGVPTTQVKMAVVIQEMIPAEISGVMFTVNVVKNNTDEMLINSTWGLGETLVSGKVIPDTYVLEKSPLRIKQKELGQKQRICVPSHIDDNLQTIFEDTPQSKRNRFTLEENALLKIARLGLEVERAFGCPQDIEWCITPDGRPVILQARPITTLSIPL